MKEFLNDNKELIVVLTIMIVFTIVGTIVLLKVFGNDFNTNTVNDLTNIVINTNRMMR